MKLLKQKLPPKLTLGKWQAKGFGFAWTRNGHSSPLTIIVHLWTTRFYWTPINYEWLMDEAYVRRMKVEGRVGDWDAYLAKVVGAKH